jgi:hypothetical protein
MNNDISKMDKIFKTGEIKQEAIDELIFHVISVEMMKLFLKNGGDVSKLGPHGYSGPHPISLLFVVTKCLGVDLAAKGRRDLVELAIFLIEEGTDVNVVDELSSTAFFNCAKNGDAGLCKLLV